MELTLTVNGRIHKFNIDDPQEKLLNILRERLELTGTKNGCGAGHCGTCVVDMNGKAVKSCLTPAKKLNDVKITTIEGISPNEPDKELHPIQKAFIETTAVQCGFCTPGLIMKLYSLFTNDPNASEEEIKEAIEDHLCRCTGYKPIFDAALLAKKYMTYETGR
ncbi:MAG: (2Fe-2S)-binding protein [Candidatus Hodarchaeales archaeon]|jgi:carbon-monoxide dehydrogenase small subunit